MYVHTLHLCFTMPLSSLIKMKSLKLRSQRNSVIAQEHLGFQTPWRLPLPSDQVSDWAASWKQWVSQSLVGFSIPRPVITALLRYPPRSQELAVQQRKMLCDPRVHTLLDRPLGLPGKRQPEVGKGGCSYLRRPGSCLLHLDNGQERRKADWNSGG